MAAEEGPIGPGWGLDRAPSGGFQGPGQSDLGGGGFGSSGDDQGNHAGGGVGRSLGGGRTINRGVEETVTVTLLPEKEGMFMFQHHNYEVKSARRASNVIRRYSDFVWLLDCLHKRYPFRQLPLLPPKRVAGKSFLSSYDSERLLTRNYNISQWETSISRRDIYGEAQAWSCKIRQLIGQASGSEPRTTRRHVPHRPHCELCMSSEKAIDAYVQHQELAVWRKQATISVQEEFTGKSFPPDLEDSLPKNLAGTFDTVRSGVKQSSEQYISLCGLMERLAKRNQGIAADYLRFSQALMTVTETSQSTYATDTNDVPLLNEGISSTAKHLTTSQSLLEDEARAWDEGVLEDFKKQRDTLVSVRDMFDRRDRYAKDNIPYLERRIESNENKLAGLMGIPEGTAAKPGEQEKLEQAVRAVSSTLLSSTKQTLTSSRTSN